MNMKAPYAIQRRPTVQPPPNLVSIFADANQLPKLLQELKDLKAQHQAEHQAALAKIGQDHANKMAEYDNHLQRIYAHANTIQKGAPGTNGVSPDPQAIAQKVLGYIRQPEDGKTPIIDEEAIARKVLKKVTIPVPQDGKSVDPLLVADLVIEKIKQDKLLKPEHIDGLSRELTSYRAQLAGKHYGETTMIRGGGDTVAAGTGVTIINANGVKTISASGGFSVLAATGAVDDSNKVFTFTSTPTFVIVNGAIYKNGAGVTIVTTTATLDNPVGTGGNIFGLG